MQHHFRCTYKTRFPLLFVLISNFFGRLCSLEYKVTQIFLFYNDIVETKMHWIKHCFLWIVVVEWMLHAKTFFLHHYYLDCKKFLFCGHITSPKEWHTPLIFYWMFLQKTLYCKVFLWLKYLIHYIESKLMIFCLIPWYRAGHRRHFVIPISQSFQNPKIRFLTC